MALTSDQRSVLAEGSLAGLSTGDAFGDQFFMLDNRGVSPVSGLPPAPWEWSDDTQMACSIVDVLNRHGRIEQDDLAESFASRMDVGRGYGAGAYELLMRVREGDRITAQDTVPFALWAAATRLTDFESAVRACAMVGGDMDTTAAIAGGVVGAHLGAEGIPEAWLSAREPLPDWLAAGN
ncbi:ADP-ribosylglycohydrolase family protein [Actinomadura hibisca]|uniref:ADP-ribosylglycohydrolase family protein n=1 Tax=Actinomadura hibisca TaxID=68565 RepID=UPI00082D3A48|nr:ADP-ribosylglycohydrolase family protein [Actinomadura hibisca]